MQQRLGFRRAVHSPQKIAEIAEQLDPIRAMREGLAVGLLGARVRTRSLVQQREVVGRLRVIGTRIENRDERGLGSREIPGGLQRQREIVAGLRKIRAQFEGLAVVGDRLARSALLVGDDAKKVPEIRIHRGGFDETKIGALGFLEPARLMRLLRLAKQLLEIR